jgi:hypothetical protein
MGVPLMSALCVSPGVSSRLFCQGRLVTPSRDSKALLVIDLNTGSYIQHALHEEDVMHSALIRRNNIYYHLYRPRYDDSKEKCVRFDMSTGNKTMCDIQHHHGGLLYNIADDSLCITHDTTNRLYSFDDNIDGIRLIPYRDIPHTATACHSNKGIYYVGESGGLFRVDESPTLIMRQAVIPMGEQLLIQETEQGALVISPPIKGAESVLKDKRIHWNSSRNLGTSGDFIYGDPSNHQPPYKTKIDIRELFSTQTLVLLGEFTLPAELHVARKMIFLPPSAEQVAVWEEKIRRLLDDLPFPRELTRIIARLML